MLISWISRYDNKGTLAARKDFQKLGKSALATKAILTGATYAFTRFTSAAVSAAAKEQASVTQLANNLKNAGFTNVSSDVEKFIKQLESAAAVSTSVLRPAFVQLFNTTQNVGASQSLLTRALDISAGTGKDLNVVVNALSRALTGNLDSLNELGTGLDKTFIKTASLSEIMAELDRRFTGQAAAGAATLAGQLASLDIIMSNFQKTYGEGVAKGFMGTINKTPGNLEWVTARVNDFGVGVGYLSAKMVEGTRKVIGYNDEVKNLLRTFFYAPKWFQNPVVDPIGTLRDSITGTGPGPFGATKQQETDLQRFLATLEAQRKKAELERLAREKQIAAEKAKQLRLSKLAAKFDLELIGIAAARARTEDKGLLNRLTALDVIAQDKAGLPVSEKALAAAERAMTSITVNVGGSVISERDLDGVIRDALSRSTVGRRGGGVGAAAAL